MFEDIPVEVSPMYEGERIRAANMFVELVGPKSIGAELVRVDTSLKNEKFEVIGPELSDLNQGDIIPFGIKIDINGEKLEEELEGVEEANTQYGKIMDELGITLIHAGSSQAKGRIERLWNTLHDRLITEFKINKITTMEQANEFFKKYIPKYNKRFAVPAENPVSTFVPLPKYVDLETLLTVKYTRQVDNAACFSYKCVTFQIQNIQISPRVTVELLISKRIGMKVRYKDKLYSVIPILDKNNIAIDNTDSISNIVNEFIYFNLLKNERIA